jgi:plasmid stabilization system protein ParE
MATLRWTIEAEKWLRDIYDYIAKDNPIAAQRTVKAIYDKAQIIKDFPEIGQRHSSESEGEIRILLYGHYRIAYLVRSNNVIDILGVFHSAMEIEKYLLLNKE